MSQDPQGAAPEKRSCFTSPRALTFHHSLNALGKLRTRRDGRGHSAVAGVEGSRGHGRQQQKRTAAASQDLSSLGEAPSSWGGYLALWDWKKAHDPETSSVGRRERAEQRNMHLTSQWHLRALPWGKGGYQQLCGIGRTFTENSPPGGREGNRICTSMK